MERGANDLHMVQLRPASATSSSRAWLKSRLVYAFCCHPGCPGKG